MKRWNLRMNCWWDIHFWELNEILERIDLGTSWSLSSFISFCGITVMYPFHPHLIRKNEIGKNVFYNDNDWACGDVMLCNDRLITGITQFISILNQFQLIYQIWKMKKINKHFLHLMFNFKYTRQHAILRKIANLIEQFIITMERT